MKITNNFNLPQALYDYVVETSGRHNDKNCYSATTILQPTRMILLKERHFDEIEVDCSEMINMLFGTSTHAIMEHFDKTGYAEVDLKLEVKDGFYLTGKCDMYNEQEHSVEDWKTATTYKIAKKDFADWERQGKIYALMLNNIGLYTDKSTFYGLLKDWTPKEHRMAKLKGEFYPDTQVYQHKFAINTNDLNEIKDFVKEKFDELIANQNVADDDLPYCSDEDTWYTGDKWAVYGTSKERALKVCNTEEEAKEYMEKNAKAIQIVKRTGEHRRCLDYCDCCQFCKYYKQFIEKEGK